MAAAAMATSGGNRWDMFAPKAEEPREPREPMGPPSSMKPDRVELWTPDEAVKAALLDLEAYARVDPDGTPFIRYVFIRDGNMLDVRTVSVVMNYIGRQTLPLLPVPLFGGHLARVDMRMFWPSDLEYWQHPRPGNHHDYSLKEGLETWEELRYDPTFALDVTKDELQFAAEYDLNIPRRKVSKQVVRKVKELGPWRYQNNVSIQHRGGDYVYPDDSGRVSRNLAAGGYTVNLRFKTETEKEITETVTEEVPELLADNVDVVRFNSRGIDQLPFVRLQELSGTVAPVVESLYFQKRVLSQIQGNELTKTNNEVYQTVWSGLYYRFRGIQTAEQFFGKGKVPSGVTDQDVFFQNFLAVGNIKGGLNAKRLFNDVRGDQRAALLVSAITGKPRAVEELDTENVREYQNKGWITLDVNREHVDVRGRGYKNLLDPVADAQEGIFMDGKGFLIYVLFNGAGALQNVVPSNVTSDRTVPDPYEQDLEPAISCAVCHFTDGSDGFKPFRNDIHQLMDLRRPPGGDIFGDLGAGKKRAFGYDTFDRLAGLYQWRPEMSKTPRRARDDVAEAMLNAVGGVWEEDTDLTKIAKVVGERLQRNRVRYWYERIDAQKALWDLGLDVPKDRARDTLAYVLPPDQRNRVGSFYPEDPTALALRNGGSVTRSDWDLFKAFAAERSRVRVEELRKTGQQK